MTITLLLYNLKLNFYRLIGLSVSWALDRFHVGLNIILFFCCLMHYSCAVGTFGIVVVCLSV